MTIHVTTVDELYGAINAFGASSSTPMLAGLNNIVEIHLGGASKKATVTSTPSVPLEPAGTNVINVFRQ